MISEVVLELHDFDCERVIKLANSLSVGVGPGCAPEAVPVSSISIMLGCDETDARFQLVLPRSVAEKLLGGLRNILQD
jgi:hypothetical protein